MMYAGMSRTRTFALLSAMVAAGLLAGCIEESPIAISPDGKTAAFVTVEPIRTGSGDFAVGAQAFRLMLVDEQRKVRVLETSTDAMLSAPGWSPDGQRLAYLRVPLPTGEQAESQKKAFEERVKALEKLVDPTWMAWATGEGSGVPSERRPAVQSQPAMSQTQDLALPPVKGMYVATAVMMLSPSTTATLVVREVRGGAVVSSTAVELPTTSPSYVGIQPQFDPAGKCVYLTAGNLVLSVDPASGEKRILASASGEGRLSPDGRTVATVSGDVVGLVAADGESAAYRRVAITPAGGPCWVDGRTVAVLEDKVKAAGEVKQAKGKHSAAGKELAPAAEPVAGQVAGPAVFVVERVRTDGALLKPVEVPVPAGASGTGNVDGLALAPDGRGLVVSVGHALVFGTVKGKASRLVEAAGMRLEQPAFSPDGKRVAVKVLETAGEKMLRTAAIAFYSADGKELYRVAIPAVEGGVGKGGRQ